MTNMEYAQVTGFINQAVIKDKIEALCCAALFTGICIASHLILHKYNADMWSFLIIFLQGVRYVCAVTCAVFVINATLISGESKRKKLEDLRREGLSAEKALEDLGMVPRKLN